MTALAGVGALLPVVVPAALAAAAVGVLLGVPRPAAVRLRRAGGSSAAPRLRPRLRGARVLAGRRRPDRELARGVEVCAALAGELRAGRPPDAALRAAADVAGGATADVLAAAAAAASVGGEVPAVLTRPGRVEAPELLRGLAACWSLCSTTGSGLARAVDRLEEAERDAQARRRAVRAELAGPRATARLLAGLPVLGIVLASAFGAAPLEVLLGTPVGRVCLVAGGTLDVVGVLWTRRLVRRAETGPADPRG